MPFGGLLIVRSSPFTTNQSSLSNRIGSRRICSGSRIFLENSCVGLLRRGGVVLRLFSLLWGRHLRDHLALERDAVLQRQFDAEIHQRLRSLERIRGAPDVHRRDLLAYTQQLFG